MLIVAPTAEPVTLAEVKVQLGITVADELSDTLITRRIGQARRWVESRTGRSLMPQTHELRLDTFAEQIPLPFPPIDSIVSVQYVDADGTLTTIDADDYVLETYPLVPYLRPAYGVSWPSPRGEPGAVRIRYQAGYDIVALDAAKTLTAITVAAPAVVSSTAHGLCEDQLIQLDIAGMTELDGLLFRVNAPQTDSFRLANLANDSALSTLGYSAFTSGTARRVAVDVPPTLIEAIALLVGHWTNYQGRIENGQFITRVPMAVEQLLDSEKVWSVA